MIIDWPPELAMDIARRRSAIIIGSGISGQSTNNAGISPKRWKPFLESATRGLKRPRSLKKSIMELIDKADFLTACQVLKDEMGHLFPALLIAEFSTPQFHAAPIHDSIIQLDSRLIISPNFDKIYETRANSLAHGSIGVKQYYSADVVEAVRSPLPVIVKNHGSVDEPVRVIFTRSDYARAREENRDFYSIMDALALTHTYLFLGCGLDDPDIRLMLEGYAFRHKFGRPHYFVLPARQIPQCVAKVVEGSMNIKLLFYDSAGNHVKLKIAIDELKGLVDSDRITLKDTLGW